MSSLAANIPDASLACARCGTFLQDLQTAERGGQVLCLPCFKRTAHAVERDEFTFARVVANTAQLSGQVFLPAVLTVVLCGLPWALLVGTGVFLPESMLWKELLFSMQYQLVVGTLEGAVILFLCRQKLAGQQPDFLDAFASARRSYWRLIWPSALETLQVALLSMMCVVPGVVRQISLLLVAPVVLFEGKKGNAALKRSSQLMSGHRWLGFAVFMLFVAPAGVPFFLLEGLIAIELVDRGAEVEAAMALVGGIISIPLQVAIAVLFIKAAAASPPISQETRDGR